MFHFLFEQLYSDKIMKVMEQLGQTPIVDEWRGWNNHNNPNFTPPHEGVLLPIYIIAGKFCPSNRDIYFSEVEKIESPMTEDRVVGRLYHEVYHRLTDEIRKFIYNMNEIQKEISFLIPKIDELAEANVDAIIAGTDPRNLGLLSNQRLTRLRMISLWKHEVKLMDSFLYFFLCKNSNPTKDTLSHIFLPFSSETQIDGSGLSMSKNLMVDAFTLSGRKIVIDIKTGEYKPLHRLTTTGYALALESHYGKGTNVDIGCIFHIDFNDGSHIPIIDCDIYPIINSLRKDFIEERNSKIVIIAEEKDPGCKHVESCPYYFHCKEELSQ